MTTSKNEAPEDLLGEVVVAQSTTGDTYGTGYAVAYSDQPTYEIEFANGRRKMWLANLTREATDNEAITYWRERAMAAEAETTP